MKHVKQTAIVILLTQCLSFVVEPAQARCTASVTSVEATRPQQSPKPVSDPSPKPPPGGCR